MDLLHRIARKGAVLGQEVAIRDALTRLSPRALADLGLEPREIPAVARLGARVGPGGATLGQVIERVRAAHGSSGSLLDRLWGALERLSERKSETLSYSPAELDRYMEEAHRLRAETVAAFWRGFGRQVAALTRPVLDAARESGPGRRLRLALVWRRAFRQTRAELATYSERELMSDLRLTRSQIDDIATEAADERVGAYIAADPALRRAGARAWALQRARG